MDVTREQIEQLQAGLDKLRADKQAEDDATAVSNQADAALAKATADANQAKLDEQAAQATVAQDFNDLQNLFNSLINPGPDTTTTTQPPAAQATHSRGKTGY